MYDLRGAWRPRNQNKGFQASFKVITPFGLVIDPEAKSRGRAKEQANARARRAELMDIQLILQDDSELGEGWIRARQVNKSPSDDERATDRQLSMKLHCDAESPIIRRLAGVEERCKRS